MKKIVSLAKVQHKKINEERRQLIINIESYLRYKKRYSETNLRKLMPRIAHIVNDYGITNPTVQDAIALEESRRAEKNGDITVRHYLIALELIAEYQGIELKIKKPSAARKMYNCLSTPECRALIDSCLNVRDKALIAILLTCGLRNAEIRAIELNDIDLKIKVIHVRDHGQHIKNGYERMAVMTVECAKLVEEWLKERPYIEGCNKVFITEYGKPMREERPLRIIQQAARRAGIDKRTTAHGLRHACATNMLRAGIPLTEVAIQLGHRSLNSTLIYLSGNIDGLRDSMNKKYKI